MTEVLKYSPTLSANKQNAGWQLLQNTWEPNLCLRPILQKAVRRQWKAGFWQYLNPLG